VHVLTNIVLLMCPFSGLLLFSLLLMLFNKPKMKLTTTTTIISLKSHNLTNHATSVHKNRWLRGAGGGGKPPAFGDF